LRETLVRETHPLHLASKHNAAPPVELCLILLSAPAREQHVRENHQPQLASKRSAAPPEESCEVHLTSRVVRDWNG